jgi:hypothetical protein
MQRHSSLENLKMLFQKNFMGQIVLGSMVDNLGETEWVVDQEGEDDILSPPLSSRDFCSHLA